MQIIDGYEVYEVYAGDAMLLAWIDADQDGYGLSSLTVGDAAGCIMSIVRDHVILDVMQQVGEQMRHDADAARAESLEGIE